MIPLLLAKGSIFYTGCLEELWNGLLTVLLLLLGLLLEELVEMRNNTTAGDGCLDDGIEFVITSDG